MTLQNLWQSASNKHAASAAAVLTNVDHNTNELLVDSCLKCHSMFQYQLGVAHFVTPLDQVGSPSGTWSALNTSDWQATKCEVCHNLGSGNPMKLAKYGAILDGPFAAGYTDATLLPPASQTVIDPTTGEVTTYTYPNQGLVPVLASRICNSCHDPADQGGDPDITLGGIDYGPQGGDSRAFLTTSHKGLNCVDCHPTRDFTPVVATSSNCGTGACHGSDRSATLPGKVHVNHL